ncbi:MAG: type II secretion system protein, partial [Bacilli bacterium]
MKKNNNRGFMLIETLICSTFIVGILIVLYTQFERINKSYEDSFKYNTVNNLYLVNNFKMYLLQNGGESLLNNLNSTNYFIDITACPSPLQEVNYCNNL